MKKRKFSPRDIGYYVLILVIVVAVIVMLTSPSPKTSTKIEDYSEVRRLFDTGEVTRFTIEDNTLTMKLAHTYGDTETDIVTHDLYSVSIFYNDMAEKIDELMTTKEDFSYNYIPSAEIPWWVSMLPYILVMGAFLVLWIVMANRAGMGGDKGVARFGRARTRLGSEEKHKVTFDDVAGADEEKEELAEIVDFLRDPQKYTALGARIPKGVLLVGPPGTGKTLIAKAVAGEANTQFLSISGSDFVELYVGVGASRVRDLFDQAKKLAPAIIFIDEIDAVGRQRGAGLGGGHDEREQTLNQLLVEMDGFSNNEGVIVMAATNRADILDNALLRPGRFDRTIYVGVPDIKGREAILKVHARNKMLGQDVDLKSIARGTPGFTGADLENLLNEAALLAARRNKRFITMAEMDEAALKVIAGPEKKSRVVSEKERKLTAYHEAGHAVASFHLDHEAPVHQITIIPRGQTGGMTIYRPTEDQSFNSRGQMFDRIVTSLGGRIAEKLFLDDISTGASNDIQQATAIARSMVTRYGMSERLGPISYDDSSQSVFIGRDFGHTKSYSEETAAMIDEEVHAIFDQAVAKCEEILTEHRDLLVTVAEYLLANETMSGETFAYVCSHGGQLPPETETTPDASVPAAPEGGQPADAPDAGEESLPLSGETGEVPDDPDVDARPDGNDGADAPSEEKN